MAKVGGSCTAKEVIGALVELEARATEAEELLTLFWNKFGPYDIPLPIEDRVRMQRYFGIDDSE